jgi:phage terminase large subunit-like protein
VAYTEEQSEDLCYYALKTILEHSDVADDFDIGLERILRVHGDGKAVAVSTSPDARDGARTTFQIFDETHRFTLPRLKRTHKTMLANVPKRMRGDPWSLEVTTAFSPGEGSIAEETFDYAKAAFDGRTTATNFFFFHRQASDGYDYSKPEDIRKAVLEASGPVAEWSDVDSIVAQWFEPGADLQYLQRVWTNRPVKSHDRAFDVVKWRELRKLHTIPDGAVVTVGFDGSRYRDATGLVVTEVATGFQQVIGVWERPFE